MARGVREACSSGGHRVGGWATPASPVAHYASLQAVSLVPRARLAGPFFSSMLRTGCGFRSPYLVANESARLVGEYCSTALAGCCASPLYCPIVRLANRHWNLHHCFIWLAAAFATTANWRWRSILSGLDSFGSWLPAAVGPLWANQHRSS